MKLVDQSIKLCLARAFAWEARRESFQRWIGLLREAFMLAGVPERRAHALALLVESSLEGLMVIARATRDRAPLKVVADEVAALVEQAVLAGKSAKHAEAVV